MQQTSITQRIIALKQQRNAVILAHLYQRPEIQALADYVGDSLELSRLARDTRADVIVFCGVRFMAETAKILNPQKTVLLPEPDAGCPMADMVTPEDVLRLRAQHPNAAVVCYINSSADVKAVSDICCTSSNAVKVVRSLREEEIIFVPDQNLGRYVASFVPEKRVFVHDGYCPIHHHISAEDVRKARALHPDAQVLAHPECIPDVLAQADYVGSTAQIIRFAEESESKKFLIGTESGVIYRLQQLCPEKRFYALRDTMVCPNMKKTTVESVLDALEQLQFRIELDEALRSKAFACIDRMLLL